MLNFEFVSINILLYLNVIKLYSGSKTCLLQFTVRNLKVLKSNIRDEKNNFKRGARQAPEYLDHVLLTQG